MGTNCFTSYTRNQLEKIPQLDTLPKETRRDLDILVDIFPFRVNNYVLDELIDWKAAPEDAMYRLAFPQPGMLPGNILNELRDLKQKRSDRYSRRIKDLRTAMNPHPGGQSTLNVPRLNGEPLHGVQHKYGETVLFFPSQGQTCHTYCTYCFRWAQFIGIDSLKFASKDARSLHDYVRTHRQVTDILFTGGDPLTMNTRLLRRYIEPFIQQPLAHVRTIRLGTKALAYWPYRVTRDGDADDLMRLFGEVVNSGLHLSVMAHFTHHRELATRAVEEAVARIRSTGAEIRCQAPLIRHINDDARIWKTMWEKQVAMGAVPYYMFVERDTGAREYFQVPLSRGFKIFTEAYNSVSGLARTVRGPVMSCTPGKIQIAGIETVGDERVFICRFIQARNKAFVNRTFFASFDEKAGWFTDLRPAFGAQKFFFEKTGFMLPPVQTAGHQPFQA